MFDKQKSIQIARYAAAQGMVLLKNEGQLLPLADGSKVAFAGDNAYYRGGAGSAEVYCDYEVTIAQGLENKVKEGRIVLCNNSDTVITTVARLSGEGDDYYAVKGQFYLTDEEVDHFEELQQNKKIKNIILLLNIPTIIDLSWIEKYPKIKSVLIVWLPGMEGGNAVADILCGDIAPGGHLTDTVAYDYSDNPSALEYENKQYFYPYEEDIYVGYRYFETFKKDRVLYPFGYGLSYTRFDISCLGFKISNGIVEVSVSVKNIGNYEGAEVVQIYTDAPNGKLGRPAHELRAYKKTKVLLPGEEQRLDLSFPINTLAAFDDTGISGVLGAYVLEQGCYHVFVGNNIRSITECGKIDIPEITVVENLSLKLTSPVDRRLNSNGEYVHCFIDESIGKSEYNTSTTSNKYVLKDVYDGKVDMKTFISQLSNDELIDISTAQPPAFPRGTAGIGNNKRYGIPNIQTADGPAGLRKTVPTVCFPCATLLACSWDDDVIYSVGKAIGEEGLFYKIDVLLAPGLNIHRNPLCGRNFEYYSEDPLVSGKSAAAFVNGVQSTGMLSTLKHFAANNKEVYRSIASSQVSERAMREIYLKGFEIAVKESAPAFIMTSYNLLNGTHTSAHYGLLTGILRNEWGFKGATMTDWRVPERQWREIKAGNNIKMPFGYPEEIVLAKKMFGIGRLTREELERNAEYILNSVMRSARFADGDMGLKFKVEDETVLFGTVFTGVNSTTVGEKVSSDTENGYVLGDTFKDKHDNDVFIYYDLVVEETSQYELSCRIATPFASSFIDVIVDDSECITKVFPLTSKGWEDWHTLPLGTILLTKGEHRLKFYIRDTERDKGIYLNWIKLKNKKGTS